MLFVQIAVFLIGAAIIAVVYAVLKDEVKDAMYVPEWDRDYVNDDVC